MIKIYRDAAANSIFLQDANGAQFTNSLQAILNETDNTLVSIRDLAKQVDIVSDEPYEEFINENDNTYGIDGSSTVNALNAEFVVSGTSGTELPEITSTLNINAVQGETINYELTANYGVGYEWDLSNVSGITTVNGNNRKILGGSGLSAGSYNIPVKAINYNGEDSKTLVLNVSTPPFANTKSVQFNNQDYLGANANLLDNTLGRNSNGSGSGDAWTISFWFKRGTATNNAQTIFYFGAQDVVNSGYIQLKYNGNTNNGRNIILTYGTNNNKLTFSTPANTFSTDWHHVLVSYDGGTTGSNSGDISSYYSRFKIYVDGSLLTTANSNNNYGYTGSISGQNLRVGRWNQNQYMRNNCKIDELAIWDSDQSNSVVDIYNSGVPFDLTTLNTKPKHWWRMGDGDTYPFLQDNGTSGNCVFQMYNMTVADITNDTP